MMRDLKTYQSESTQTEYIERVKCAQKIQKCFRHFLLGRKIRNEMKYSCKNVWKLKSFAVRCALDESAFLYAGSYKNYVNNVYKSIEVWLHQDYDDDEDYRLTNTQRLEFEKIKKLGRIVFADIKELLKCLTLGQIQQIQLP